MPRWYAVFQHRGRPAETLEMISQCIRRDNLSQAVSRISVEKRANRYGEFYFALGIDSDVQGEPPESLDHFLTIPLFKRPQPGFRTRFEPFAHEQLRSMMGSEQTIEDIARVLRYARSGDLAPDDPFADPHDGAEPQDNTTLDRTQGYDRLLTWISAMGSGSLAQFRAACVVLGLSAPQDGSGRILRRLRLLGHIETSPDGRRWSVTPTALVQNGVDTDQMFLAGARDAALLTTLRMYGNVEEIPMERGDAPSHVAVHLGDPRMLAFIDALRPLDAGRAGERIANVLSDLDGWATTLQRVAGVHPEMFDLRQYDGTTFIDVPNASEGGLYAFYEPSPAGFAEGELKFTLYRDHLTGHWLRGDWYGLRYLAERRRRGASGLPVRYDPANGRLAILRDHRWPELYERTIVLASGRLPVINGPWLNYLCVSRTLLERLAVLLHLDIIESDGDLPDA